MKFRLHPLALVVAALPGHAGLVHAQAAVSANQPVVSLETVTVEASADASAQGLSPAYAGGQVARGGRVGILGTQDNMSTPFSVTSYTNELIQDKQARSVADVLQNDPGVRVARGFGNFQESYFIRGQILNSDDIAYNGLYNLLPRQYIASEFFERVEVLRGASAFLSGAAPGGSGAGGTINLVPKRAPNEPLTRLTTGIGSGGQSSLSADLARRFGPDDRMGIRINAVGRTGDTAVDDEHSRLGAGLLGLDWRGDRLRLSADVGWQDNRLKRTRPSIDLDPGVTSLPSLPKPSANWAQPWTYSNERDTFGTLRGEYDFSDQITGWAALGLRNSKEANSLGGIKVLNGQTGAATTSRFDNTREDFVHTGEIGLRAKARTGPVGHEFVFSASYFDLRKKNAYAMSLSPFATNLYNPVEYDSLPIEFAGGELSDPLVQGRIRTNSFAFGDTLSFFDDTVLLTLGLRHQRLATRDYDYDTGALVSSNKASRNSPAVGAVFKLDPKISLYANYIESLAQGGTVPFGTPLAANYGQTLPPYVSRQKEVGVKYDGGKLGGSIAFFSTNRPHGTLDTSNVFSVSGEDRYQGVELTAYGEAARGVRVLGGVTWLNAKQRETGTFNVDGNRIVGVPNLQANLGVEWDIPGVNGLTAEGRVVYTGRTYVNDTNTLRAPSWTRFDAGLRYAMDVGGHLVTLRARVDNIANKAYWASSGGYIGAGYPGSGYLVEGLPRTFWLSASMDF